MSDKRLGIACALRNYCPSVQYHHDGRNYSAEFGGDLPRCLVSVLREAGAEILRYNHRGVVSTVVNF